MKKFIVALLSAVLILQTAFVAVAAPTEIPLDGLMVTVTPDITLEVKKDTGSAWLDSVTLGSGEYAALRASINMDAVRTAFIGWYNSAYAHSNEVLAQAVPVVGEFTVTLEYPQGVVLPALVLDKTDMSDFSAATSDLFVANGARSSVSSNANGNKELIIPFKVKPGVTLGTLYNYTNDGKRYFPDMELIVPGYVTASASGAPHTLYGHLDGVIHVNGTGASWSMNTDIVFEEREVPDAVIDVISGGGGFGGGGGSVIPYSIVTFNTNGGATLDNKSYRSDKKVSAADLPVPKRDGYVFNGWYLDEALTQKVDAFTPKKDMTLYAGWVRDVKPTGYVPELLNGVDHFAYIIGYPDGTVQPQGSITRAEVATIFFRLLKDEVRDGNLTQENPYVDVKEGAWYNAPISTLTKLGILTGWDGEVFAPNADITRAEFAAIIARFADKAVEIAHDFEDVTGHWAEESIYKAAALGWIQGYDDNTYKPNNEITRAEAMTLINRVVTRVPETTADLLNGMQKWSDNMDMENWYYIAVQEATNSHDYERKENGYETWTELAPNRDWSTYEK